MKDAPKIDDARRLAWALSPRGHGEGLEYCICEQVLADALGACPRPRTLGELQRALDRDHHHRLNLAFAFFDNLRLRATEEPDRPLDELFV